jgi:outer membrane autotransporter protein
MLRLGALSVGVLLAFSGAAFAADLYVPPAAPVAAPAVSSNWDGAYIGATVGYGWSHVDLGAPGSGSGDGSGITLGGQVGYNFHVADSLVLGIQGNLDWNNETGSGGVVSNVHGNWDGAIVGRVGIDAGEFLPYVEAGVAFANETATLTGAGDFSNTYTGWTVGAGVEFALADNWSVNVEYRYNDYGTQTIGPVGFAAPATLTDNEVRLGINYHF